MMRPGGIRGVIQYLIAGFYPVQALHILYMTWRGKLMPSTWPEIVEQHKVKGLRSLAKEYGVSHESVRRAHKTAETLYKISLGKVHNGRGNSALK
jgi:hypothetical protein